MSDNPEKVQVEVEEVKEEKSEPVLEPESVLEPEVKEEVNEEEVKEDSEKDVPVKVDESLVETKEVVNKVRDVLSDIPEPKDRITELENKVNKLVEILKSSYRQVEIDDNVWRWTMELLNKREKICDL